jgi:pilus assembly protein CpaF
MTTIHANSSRDCLSRMESLILTSDVEIPLAALRKQMASAIQLIVQLKRDKSGTRVVQEICELTGVEQNTVTMQTLFTRDRRKEPRPAAGPGPEASYLYVSGLVPSFMDRFHDSGVQFPPNFFDPNTPVTYRPD